MKRICAEKIGHCDGSLLESPVWDSRTDMLWFVDIAASQVCRMTARTGDIVRFDVAVVVSALVLREGGGLMAATAAGFCAMDISGDEPVLGETAGPALPAEWRMNDGACDRQGRFWAGSLSPNAANEAERGRLYSLEPSGMVEARGGAFRTQNGLAWNPEGGRMYMSDSHPLDPHILCCDFDPQTGERSRTKRFASGERLGGRPDGAAMDSEGCYWIAASDSGRVLRMTPDGLIDAEIHLEAPNPTNLCFAGGDRRTVFITTLKRPGLPGGEIYVARSPHDGFPDTPYRRAG